MKRRIGLMAGLSAVVGSVVLLYLSGLASTRAQDQQTPPEAPLGLPPVFWPEDNPYSPAKAYLGKLLYFDPRLSSDGTISCATCHAPEKAYTDCAPVSIGIGKQKGGRSAPTVINRAYTTLQF
jgi:cytochrome c peroxidase